MASFFSSAGWASPNLCSCLFSWHTHTRLLQYSSQRLDRRIHKIHNTQNKDNNDNRCTVDCRVRKSHRQHSCTILCNTVTQLFNYVTITRFFVLHKMTNRQLRNMVIIASPLPQYSHICHYHSDIITVSFFSYHTYRITVEFSPFPR